MEETDKVLILRCGCGHMVSQDMYATHKADYCEVALVECPLFAPPVECCVTSCTGFIPRGNLRAHLVAAPDTRDRLHQKLLSIIAPASQDASLKQQPNGDTLKEPITTWVPASRPKKSHISEVPLSVLLGTATPSTKLNREATVQANFIPGGTGVVKGLNCAEGYYDGQINSDHKRHGQGVMTYTGDKAGSVYTGGWRDDLRSGEGLMRQKDKDGSVMTYRGNWVRGKRSGHGVMSYGDGSEYSGEWKDGAYHGAGTFTSMLAMFVGDWDCTTGVGGAAGRGVITYRNGECYEGEWVGGKRNGQGSLTYKNGDVYAGLWSKNMRHGEGKLTPAKGGGVEIDCVFEKD
eukprot:gene26955-33607_t